MIERIDTIEFSGWVMGLINSNIKRSWLAEYLVGKALGVVSKVHEQWEDFDVRFGAHRIEVKSSGIITPPFPTTHINDNPRFDVARRVAYWCYETARRLPYSAPTRPADLYVFCLHTARTEEEFDPFDIRQWQFVCASTARIEAELGGAKSISWARAQRLGSPATFQSLRGHLLNQLEGATQ